MIQIREYLTTKVSKSKIKATNETIRQIVKEEIDKYGHDCNLNHVDVSQVTDMSCLFVVNSNNFGKEYEDMNPDISEWDVSNVTNMGYIFDGCKKFNCNISKWDVSNVKNMSGMFCECESFNQYIGDWDVSNVENMNCMFYICTSFNQDLSGWDVSNVISTYYAFGKCNIQEKYKPHFKK